MKKISLLLWITLLSAIAGSAQSPYTFARIKGIWNTHSVPVGPVQDSTWLSVANYWKLGGTMIGPLKYTGATPTNGYALKTDALGNLTYGFVPSLTSFSALGPLSYNNGTGVFSISLATTSANGYLSNSDWNLFNGKQPAGSYLTALSGDGVATGPGSAALTLASVNSNIGTYGDATHSVTVTTNGKGLITAISSNSISGSPTGSAGGDLSSTYPNPTVAKINGNTVPSGAVTGDILYASGSNVFSRLAIGSGTQILGLSGGIPAWIAAPATGVTSVGLSMPSIFTVSNSPVTSAGTLTATFNTQSANTIFSGPSSGGAATPTFRTLVAADIPSLSATYVPFTGAGSSVNLNNQTLVNVNQLGIGTASPSSVLHVVSSMTGVNRGIISDQYGTYGSAKEQQRRARGPVGSPQAVTSTDTLGSWAGLGHDGTSFVSGGVTHFITAGTVSTGVVPCRWELKNANHLGIVKVALSVDTAQNFTVSGKIIKSGGTSSQFLKADGSVDASTYLTGNQTITLTGNVTGSGTTSIATTIPAATVTNAMLAGGITDANLATPYIKADGTRALTGNWAAGAYKITADRDSATGTLANTIPIGPTSQRPTAPRNGMIRFNTTINRVEFGNSVLNSWVNHARLTGDTMTGILSVPSFRMTGSPTNGYVLTSDASGNATWQAASGGVTSVTGTTNRITSSGGSTPAIDISASYVGQSSITTLGTIGTGTWNSAITPPASNTISISGAAVTLNGHSTYQEMDSVSSNATAWTASYSNILVGQTVQVNYWKTTASDCTITFPSGTTISNSCPGTPSGVTLKVSGTSVSEFFTLWIQRITATQYLLTGAQHTQ